MTMTKISYKGRTETAQTFEKAVENAVEDVKPKNNKKKKTDKTVTEVTDG